MIKSNFNNNQINSMLNCNVPQPPFFIIQYLNGPFPLLLMGEYCFGLVENLTWIFGENLAKRGDFTKIWPEFLKIRPELCLKPEFWIFPVTQKKACVLNAYVDGLSAQKRCLFGPSQLRSVNIHDSTVRRPIYDPENAAKNSDSSESDDDKQWNTTTRKQEIKIQNEWDISLKRK